MLDKGYVGKEYPSFTVEVEKGRLRFFAKAIGETDPVYFDEDAAAAKGFRGIPAPPTFPFTIAMDANQPFMVLEDMGVDITRSMHGDQSFSYHGDICAGDVITGRQRIVDIFDKKGGALNFIVTETTLDNQDGERVCDLRTVIIVRGEGGGQ